LFEQTVTIGGKPARRELQRVEAIAGDANLTDGAAEPGLRCEPSNDLDAVVLVLRHILIAQNTASSLEPRSVTRMRAWPSAAT
jgi:hypothetical protein